MGTLQKADLLSRFIMLGKDSLQTMTDKALRDVILNFIIAGNHPYLVAMRVGGRHIYAKYLIIF